MKEQGKDIRFVVQSNQGSIDMPLSYIIALHCTRQYQ